MSLQKPSILFVCLGNICRSPSAEGVFEHKAKQHGFDVIVDSAGTAGYHKAAPPDKRSQQVAKERGYDLSGLKCRRVTEEDFAKFDYIIGMDNKNVRDLKQKCPEPLQYKISLFMSYCDSPFDEVPDPYYSGGKAFGVVLDLIEQAADGLLLSIVKASKGL